MGWFEDEPINIEGLVARSGETVQRVSMAEAGGADGQGKGGGGEGGARIVHQEEGGTIEAFPEEEPQRLAP